MIELLEFSCKGIIENEQFFDSQIARIGFYWQKQVSKHHPPALSAGYRTCGEMPAMLPRWPFGQSVSSGRCNAILPALQLDNPYAFRDSFNKASAGPDRAPRHPFAQHQGLSHYFVMKV